VHISRKTFLFLAVITLFGFGLAGAVLIYFIHDKSFSLFTRGLPVHHQILEGVAGGLAASLILLLMIRSSWMSGPRDFFRRVVKEAKLKFPDIIFLSLAAGIGEELFFRGAIQPWLGIIFTSLVFVALHGYLDPRDGKMMLYGLSMVLVSMGLGLLYNLSGIYAAMAAHFTIDLVLFTRLRYFE